MPNFTDLAVRSLPEGLYFDEKVKSFGIRVGKNRKTWLVIKGPNRTKVSLGHYPVMSLQEARKRAQIELGTPTALKSTLTFPEALDLFLAQDRWKPRSKYVLEHSLRWHFKWTRPLAKITHEDIAQVLDGIKGRGARVHALKDIRTFFNWCVPRYLPASPAAGLKMPPYVHRERVLNDEELKAVWLAALTLDTYGAQVRALILTGQRVNQIVSFKQTWIQNDFVVFPSLIMKSGREHTIPLLPLAAATLPLLNIRSMQGKKKKDLDRLSGVTGFTLHDLRRTFSTGLAALNVPQHVTERLLDHQSGVVSGVAAIYNKYSYLPEMREALNLWESKISSLVRPV